MTQLHRTYLRIPAVKYLRENPLPCHRGEPENYPASGPDLKPEDREGLGWQCNYRVLPDRLQDDFSADLVEQDIPALVLENDHLRATFLPGLGGRLASLFDKDEGRELLFYNTEIRMRSVGSRHAWFAGGIEWNWGVWGHSTLSSSPLFAGRIRSPGGEPALRLYGYERCHGLVGQLDFHLPADSRVLFADVRIVNTRAGTVPLYYWSNIALREAPDIRVLAPADEAIYPYPPSYQVFCPATLPKLSIFGNKDASYTYYAPFAHEVFFRLSPQEYPWVAAFDKQGNGFFQASTSGLRGRKVYMWGNHQGGRHWQEYLSSGGERYLEIQAGMCRTQRHMEPFPAGCERRWTECFGAAKADAGQLHSDDWGVARKCAGQAISGHMPQDEIERYHRALAEIAVSPPEEHLFSGDGWGALERLRAKSFGEQVRIPDSTPFPDESMGEAQQPWVRLLVDGALPALDPGEAPGSWMIQEEWRKLLVKASEGSSAGDWQTWLHLGVAWREALQPGLAKESWQRSIELAPNPIALRSLAHLYASGGDPDMAIDSLSSAVRLAHGNDLLHTELVVELADLLCRAGRFADALTVLNEVSPEAIQRDIIRLRQAQVALGLRDTDTLESILEQPFTTIREGQRVLGFLWYSLWELREANNEPQAVTESIRDRVRREHPLPWHLDFTGVSEEMIEQAKRGAS